MEFLFMEMGQSLDSTGFVAQGELVVMVVVGQGG